MLVIVATIDFGLSFAHGGRHGGSWFKENISDE
jgi:hypothetical protein